jgi:hypothetical protein
MGLLTELDAETKSYDSTARGAIRSMIVWLCVLTVLFTLVNGIALTVYLISIYQ